MRVNVDKKGTIHISDFSPLQAYKIAIKLEEGGIAFYRDLGRQLKDEEARREIGFMIRQEEDHLKTFKAMLAEAKSSLDDAFEEDDIVDHLKTHIFDASVEKDVADRADHRHTTLEEALNMERRSVVFYQGCLDQTTDTAARKAFSRIIEEEKAHQAKFASLLRVKCLNSGDGCLL
jgi:rubrerythrin